MLDMGPTDLAKGIVPADPQGANSAGQRMVGVAVNEDLSDRLPPLCQSEDDLRDFITPEEEQAGMDEEKGKARLFP